MIKIGITGSVASGKSAAAKIFCGRKFPLFDADKEVRKIYNRTNFKKTIYRKFKFKNKKNIKEKIKKKIHENGKFLIKLEKIIHPLVRNEQKKFIKKNINKKCLIFEIPLLVESKLMKNYDKIIFINSKKNLRLKRYLKRGKTKKLFDLLDRRQMSSSKKLKFCDYIINNNGSFKNLKLRVKMIKKKYE